MSTQQTPQVTIEGLTYDVSKLSPEIQGHFYALSDARTRRSKAQLDVHIYANAEEALSNALKEGVTEEAIVQEIIEAEEA